MAKKERLMASGLVVKPVTLTGQVARLEPIGQEHAEDLVRAASDRAISWPIPPDAAVTRAVLF